MALMSMLLLLGIPPKLIFFGFSICVNHGKIFEAEGQPEDVETPGQVGAIALGGLERVAVLKHEAG